MSIVMNVRISFKWCLVLQGFRLKEFGLAIVTELD